MAIAHLVFWSLAFLLMAGMIACAARGVVHVRRGQLAAHRRAMLAAAGLLIAFLLSYVAKVVLLGHEDLALWTPREVALLRVHETFVALMLLCGGTARWLARRFGRAGDLGALAPPATLATPSALAAPARPVRSASPRALHRRLGRAAVVSGLCGLLTAGGLLVTMVRHASRTGAATLDRQHPGLHQPLPPRHAVAALLPPR
jgi:uncharacterized membrane protein YozB (DUF420 family)